MSLLHPGWDATEFAENLDWSLSPKAYIEETYAALNRTAAYKGKISRKCRCVRVTYANDFHVDVVPYVSRLGGEYIVNRDEDRWERTNPDGFTAWTKRQDETANGRVRRTGAPAGVAGTTVTTTPS